MTKIARIEIDLDNDRVVVRITWDIPEDDEFKPFEEKMVLKFEEFEPKAGAVVVIDAYEDKPEIYQDDE